MAVKKEVSIEVLKKAEKMLAALPVKEPEKKQLDEALEEMKPQLEAALGKGYSRADLVELLGKQGLEVREYQLKLLLATPRATKTE